MVDVLELSARIIDSGLDFDPVSRLTQEVSDSESSLMAKAIFGEAAAQSDKHHKTPQ